MRYLAIVFCCLAGGIAAAQSVAEPAPASTPKPAEQSPTQSVALPTEAPTAQPVAAPMEKTAAQPDAKPVEKAASPPVDTPAEKQSAPPAAAPVEKADTKPAAPAEKAAAQPEAKPAEQAGTAPVKEPVVASCPGNPNALGTSRVLTVSPDELSRIGTIQYKQTLPLKDHEVVLTFDDGPIPPYSNIILDALDAQCVKATYFMVGEMAHAYPSIARRIYNAGHTIGTHSQHHPFGFERLSMQRVEREVDGGIASVDAALGDPKAVAPFFRIPGLGRTNAIEHFLQAKGLVTWSADIDTNDWWRGTTPGAVLQRAMSRLNARGRGIILMHDIHPATALVLPTLLRELKRQGYHVVQVVPAGERPASVPELVAKSSERKGNWPRVMKASATKTAADEPVKRHHRLKKPLVSEEPTLTQRVRRAFSSDEPAARHHHKKVIASVEPARHHRLKRSIASDSDKASLHHHIKRARKHRPSVASLPKAEYPANQIYPQNQF